MTLRCTKSTASALALAIFNVQWAMYNECPMSNAGNVPIDSRERSLIFSRDIIRFLKALPNNTFTQPVINQLLRSSTSIGANFNEAKNAGSKKDFRNKVFIAKKEASESLYWLRLLEESTNSNELKRLQNECQEIILILQSIANKVSSSA